MIFENGSWLAGFYIENNVPYKFVLKIVILSGCVLAAFSGVSQKRNWSLWDLKTQLWTTNRLHYARCHSVDEIPVFYWGLQMIDLNKGEFFLRDQNDQTERMKKNEILFKLNQFYDCNKRVSWKFQIEFVDSFFMMRLECVECECVFWVRTSNPLIWRKHPNFDCYATAHDTLLFKNNTVHSLRLFLLHIGWVCFRVKYMYIKMKSQIHRWPAKALSTSWRHSFSLPWSK